MHWRQTKRIDCAFLLWATYAFTAVMCVYNYQAENYAHMMKGWDVSFIPFLYLFVVVWIWLSSYSNFTLNRQNCIIRENRVVNILGWLFIFSGIIAVYYGWTNSVELMIADEWDEIRDSVYAGDEIEMYGSPLERLSKNINNYLSPLGYILAFYQLTKQRINLPYTLLLFVVWFAPTFMNAMLVASRGMVITLFIQFAACYIIFSGLIPTKRKKVLWSLLTCCSILMVAYLVAVSSSRFEEEASSSVLYYIGHSMLSFNDGIMNTMHSFAGGKYMFRWFIDLFGGNSSFSWTMLGATHGTAFFTFVGALYADYGFVGTLFFSVMMMCVIRHYTRRRFFTLPSLIIVVYFVTYLLNGAMVIGPSVALQWFMVALIAMIIQVSYKIKL